MTNEEAIKILEKMKARMVPLTPLLEGKSKDEEAVDIAIEALEKQIPKKIKMPMDAFFVCPVCAARIMSLDEFCIHCGQRIER